MKKTIQIRTMRIFACLLGILMLASIGASLLNNVSMAQGESGDSNGDSSNFTLENLTEEQLPNNLKIYPISEATLNDDFANNEIIIIFK